MWICSNCGHENPDAAKECICGYYNGNRTPVVQKNYCHHCGAEIESGATVCTQCGFSTSSGQIAAYQRKSKKWLIPTLVILIAAVLVVIIVVNGSGSSIDTAEKSEAVVETEVSEAIGPNLRTIYNTYCDSEWAEVGSDGSYLSIDTNPSDIDDYNNYSAYFAVQDVNTALGLPDYVWEEMCATRALDGTLSEEVNGISVSWSYHPDKGLKVIYKLS